MTDTGTLPPPHREPQKNKTPEVKFTLEIIIERHNITFTLNTQDKVFKQGIVLSLKFYLLKDTHLNCNEMQLNTAYTDLVCIFSPILQLVLRLPLLTQ